MVAELAARRVSTRWLARSPDRAAIDEALATTLYHEGRRLEHAGGSERDRADRSFHSRLAAELRRVDAAPREPLLRGVVDRYAPGDPGSLRPPRLRFRDPGAPRPPDRAPARRRALEVAVAPGASRQHRRPCPHRRRSQAALRPGATRHDRARSVARLEPGFAHRRLCDLPHGAAPVRLRGRSQPVLESVRGVFHATPRRVHDRSAQDRPHLPRRPQGVRDRVARAGTAPAVLSRRHAQPLGGARDETEERPARHRGDRVPADAFAGATGLAVLRRPLHAHVSAGARGPHARRRLPAHRGKAERDPAGRRVRDAAPVGRLPRRADGAKRARARHDRCPARSDGRRRGRRRRLSRPSRPSESTRAGTSS